MRKFGAYIILLFLLSLFAVDAMSQSNTAQPTIITRARIIDGDTLPHVRLPEVRSYARRKFKSKKAAQRYTKLVYNVKRTLPYARIAAVRIRQIEDSLALLTTDKERKAYIKAAEKQLFDEFEAPLRKLTISQGRILIKLIDRETGDTSYELIKALKGRFSAFMWQSVARIFGSNLKATYDAEGTDREIEVIVQMIDDGQL